MTRDRFVTLEGDLREHVWCWLCAELIRIEHPPFFEDTAEDFCRACAYAGRHKSYVERTAAWRKAR